MFEARSCRQGRESQAAVTPSGTVPARRRKGKHSTLQHVTEMTCLTHFPSSRFFFWLKQTTFRKLATCGVRDQLHLTEVEPAAETPCVPYVRVLRPRTAAPWRCRFVLTAQRSPPVTLPQVRHEVLQVHRAEGSVVAPVVHLAAPAGHKHVTCQHINATCPKSASYCFRNCYRPLYFW